TPARDPGVLSGPRAHAVLAEGRALRGACHGARCRSAPRAPRGNLAPRPARRRVDGHDDRDGRPHRARRDAPRSRAAQAVRTEGRCGVQARVDAGVSQLSRYREAASVASAPSVTVAWGWGPTQLEESRPRSSGRERAGIQHASPDVTTT